MKKVWLTSLVSEDKIKNFITRLNPYGVVIEGHLWEDNLDKMSWLGAGEELIKPDTGLWLIFASPERFSAASVRYGLALLAATVQARKGLSFPIILLTEGGALSDELLPTPLKGVDFLSCEDSATNAKIVARLHSPVKQIVSEYRLDICGNQQIGQWFEVGPLDTNWNGALFGVSGGEITFHGVGPKGALPSKAVLNYPLKGLRLKMGEKEYTAWAVQNELDPRTSYFVQVKGAPEAIIFGSYSSLEAAGGYVLKLS